MYPTATSPASGIFVEQQVLALRALGLDVSVLFVDRLRNGMADYVRVPSLVRRAVTTYQPDLVHVMYGGVLADLTTCVVRDRPTVVTYHGSDVLGEQAAGPARRLLAGIGVRASRRAARRAAGIVVVSEALHRLLARERRLPPVRVIPCGIDFSRFTPLERGVCLAATGWESDRFHVLFNSNNGDPVKRPALARAAVERLRQSGISAELHEMQGLKNEDVPVWLGASDVLLLTSLHEGSPTIVKEALACNCPVVSVDVGDVRRRLNGIDGCYVAEADPGDLAAKLRLVRGRGRLVDARTRIAELSRECTASEVAAFYRRVLDTARRPLHAVTA
jgi:glycosyltransferase involved in cell wall biosynthesis